MLRAAVAVLAVTAIASAGLAQSGGNAACDDFLKKLEVCIDTKIPSTERDSYKSSLDSLKKAFAGSTDPMLKNFVETNCKATADQLKPTLNKFYGCAF